MPDQARLNQKILLKDNILSDTEGDKNEEQVLQPQDNQIRRQIEVYQADRQLSMAPQQPSRPTRNQLLQNQNPLEVIDPNEASDEPYIQMIWADDEFEEKVPRVKKRMGRIPQNYEDYIEESNRRIENWRRELEKFPPGSLQRDGLRNKISALRSRMKLKTENKNSNTTIWTLSKRVTEVAQIVEIELNNDPEGGKYFQKIMEKLKLAESRGKLDKKSQDKKSSMKETITSFVGFKKEGTL